MKSNSSNLNVFYVYSHRRKDTGEVFYIGKGKGRRAHTKSGRSELWGRIASKYGFYVSIITDELSEKDALTLEKELILKHDNLCNFTDGGEGISGYRHSEEAKIKIRLAHAGKKQSPEIIEARAAKLRGKKRTAEFGEEVRRRNLGRKASKEARLKMSASRKGKKRSFETIEKVASAHRGMKRSEESRNRMRESQKKRPVICLNKNVEFDSLSDAVRWLISIGFERATKGGVWRSLNSTVNGTAYGFSWKYADV